MKDSHARVRRDNIRSHRHNVLNNYLLHHHTSNLDHLHHSNTTIDRHYEINVIFNFRQDRRILIESCQPTNPTLYRLSPLLPRQQYKRKYWNPRREYPHEQARLAGRRSHRCTTPEQINMQSQKAGKPTSLTESSPANTIMI